MTELADIIRNIKPQVLGWIADAQLAGVPGATVVGLASDGSVLLTGNQSVAPGVTIDGYSISALGALPYVMIGNSAITPNERALAGGTGILLTDGGPNAAATLSVDAGIVATLTGVQTLTNKTLTAPVVTNPSISGGGTWAGSPSLTTPSITDLTNMQHAHLGAASGGVLAAPTGAALSKTDDTNVTLTLAGSPAVALLAASSITVGWAGTLSPARGGAGANLSATGGANQFVRQSGAGSAFTVSVIALADIPAGVGLTTRQILTAGLGLSGGGDLTADRTITLTSSSNPGAAAAILASTAGGALSLVSLTLTGALSVGSVSSSLLPTTADTYDLGSSTKLWRKGWLSELDAVLFAKNTIQVTGGYQMITKAEGLVPVGMDIATGDKTIDFGAAIPTGDFVVFRAAGSLEYVTILGIVAPTLAAGAAGSPNGAYKAQVTFVSALGETVGGTEATITVVNQQIAWSAIPLGPTGTTSRKLYRTAAAGLSGTEKLVATIADNTTTTYTDNVADGALGATITVKTRYPVTRDVDGSGADAWPAGSVWVDFGQSGDGRIELNSYATPRISIIKQGGAWNTNTEVVRIGDLNGLGGASVETYGFYAGDGTNYLRYDPVTSPNFQIKAGAGAVSIDANGISIAEGLGIFNQIAFKNGATTYSWIYGNGSGNLFINTTLDLRLGDSASVMPIALLKQSDVTIRMYGGQSSTFGGLVVGGNAAANAMLDVRGSGIVTGSMAIGTYAEHTSMATPATPAATKGRFYHDTTQNWPFYLNDAAKAISMGMARANLATSSMMASGGAANFGVTNNVENITFAEVGTKGWAATSMALPTGWAGRTVTVALWWSPSSVNTGNIQWNIELRRVNHGTLLPSTATVTATITAAGPGVINQIVKNTTTLSLSAWADGDVLDFLVYRLDTNAGDTFAGSGQLQHVELSIVG